jgi:hypothetical protein
MSISDVIKIPSYKSDTAKLTPASIWSGIDVFVRKITVARDRAVVRILEPMHTTHFVGAERRRADDFRKRVLNEV